MEAGDSRADFGVQKPSRHSKPSVCLTTPLPGAEVSNVSALLSGRTKCRGPMSASIAVLARVSPGVLGVGFGPVDLERLAYVAEGIDELMSRLIIHLS